MPMLLLGGLLACSATGARTDEQLRGEALVEALRQGGFNIYFRHAATDWSLSDHVSAPDDWLSCDADEMRQLAPAGRETSRAIGEAIRALGIPVARVYASPYCRTVETAELMELGAVETTTDIINMRAAQYFGGASAVADTARRRFAAKPPVGSNVVLVAHGNVLNAAGDVYVGEAEAAIFRPDGEGGFALVARVTPATWSELSGAYAAR
ncbi:MAG: histidine phosphatase family protein [Gammaproteobacteria bacterium]|nr:histidine phosphatase family protein [Gammaproteobacteria bacterium]